MQGLRNLVMKALPTLDQLISITIKSRNLFLDVEFLIPFVVLLCSTDGLISIPLFFMLRCNQDALVHKYV